MLTSQAPVYTPKTLAEALHVRAENPDAMPIAGGTDIMVFLESGTLNPPSFLDLWGLRELAVIRPQEDGGVSIGALCTHSELIAHPHVNAAATILVEACRTVGAQQIQNRGTLAGNVANGSPAGDTLQVLLALDAEIEVESLGRGSRRIRMASLYTGYRRLAMKPDELITWIHLPPRHPADRTHFRKVGTRLAQAISKVILAVRLRVIDDTVTEARVALGSVAPIPVRSPAVETALVGSTIDPNAAVWLGRDITPIDDIRSTAEYRMTVSRRTLRSCLTALKNPLA